MQQICKACGGPILITAFLNSGVCCDNCKKKLEKECSDA